MMMIHRIFFLKYFLWNSQGYKTLIWNEIDILKCEVFRMMIFTVLMCCESETRKILCWMPRVWMETRACKKSFKFCTINYMIIYLPCAIQSLFDLYYTIDTFGRVVKIYSSDWEAHCFNDERRYIVPVQQIDTHCTNSSAQIVTT